MTMPSGLPPKNIREEIWLGLPVGQWVIASMIRHVSSTGKRTQVAALMHELANEGLVVEEQKMDGTWRWKRTQEANSE